MKKLLFVLATVLGISANASHLSGGFINVIQKGMKDTVQVAVTLFSDPQGLGMPQTITLSDHIKINNFYQTPTTFTLSQQSNGSWQGLNVTTYSTTMYLVAGEHRFIYTNCCRGMLVNATSSMNSNFTIALDYKKSPLGTTPNSAPYILNYLPVKWISGVTSQSMLFAFDMDGDSILIEMDDAINQHANNTFVPLAPFSQLNNYGSYSVSPNGLVKWNPSSLGQYGTGYKIKEYRNGQLIGVNRIQQVYQVENGNTPIISAPFNMTFNNDSTVTINHDVANGDSLYVGFLATNYQNAQLVILGTTINKLSNTTWSVTDVAIPNTYKGYLRISGSNSNMDYPINLVVNSTIGIEENLITPDLTYLVYDWCGRYVGNTLDGLKGLYVIRFSNGKIEKVLIN